MAEPNQFQDYPGVENLGGVQNFNLEGVRDIISQMEEEKGNYIERPEDGFNMDRYTTISWWFCKKYCW
jgi:hypothetical protein